MLGQQIAEFHGKLTGQKVLPLEASGPSMESYYQQTGKLMGVDATNILTVISTAQPVEVCFKYRGRESL